MYVIDFHLKDRILNFFQPLQILKLVLPPRNKDYFVYLLKLMIICCCRTWRTLWSQSMMSLAKAFLIPKEHKKILLKNSVWNCHSQRKEAEILIVGQGMNVSWLVVALRNIPEGVKGESTFQYKERGLWLWTLHLQTALVNSDLRAACVNQYSQSNMPAAVGILADHHHAGGVSTGNLLTRIVWEMTPEGVPTLLTQRECIISLRECKLGLENVTHQYPIARKWPELRIGSISGVTCMTRGRKNPVKNTTGTNISCTIDIVSAKPTAVIWAVAFVAALSTLILQQIT